MKDDRHKLVKNPSTVTKTMKQVTWLKEEKHNYEAKVSTIIYTYVPPTPPITSELIG